MKKLILGYLLISALIPLGNNAEIKSCNYSQETLGEEIPDHISISLKMAWLEKQAVSSPDAPATLKCETYDAKKRLLMRINPVTRAHNIANIIAAEQRKAIMKAQELDLER